MLSGIEKLSCYICSREDVKTGDYTQRLAKGVLQLRAQSKLLYYNSFLLCYIVYIS